MNDNMKVTAGVDVRNATVEHYRQIYDMLGGDVYYSDSNKNDSGAALYKTLGDKIAYDFTNDISWAGGYAQVDYNAGVLNSFVMGGFTTTSFNYHNRFIAGEKKIESDPENGNQMKAGVSSVSYTHLTLPPTPYV